MVTEIYIKSDLFPAYPNEEEDINHGRFGKRLGEFVKAVLQKDGIQVADLYATDSCYEQRIDQFDFSVYVLTGNIDGEENEFLISIEPKKEYVRKWFKKIPTKEVLNKVSSSIIRACQENEKIKVVQSQ